MWTRKIIKGNAKRVLSRNYWIPFFVCLLVALLSGNFNFGNFNGSVNPQYTNIQLYEELGTSYSINFSNLLPVNIPFYLLPLGIFMIVAAIALSVFLINPLRVGKARYFVKNIEEKAEIGEVFKVFSEGHYMNIVKVMLLYDVKVFLWTLCFIIPGIVKGYEYIMIPYILAENGGMSSREVFERTKVMTSGEKFDIFVLGLSFFGWMILGAIFMGIGTLFVNPYLEATNGELYYCLKQKEFI